MKKTIKIKDIDSSYFVGARDQNIKLLENKFDSKIVLRGDQLIIKGERKKEQVLKPAPFNLLKY